MINNNKKIKYHSLNLIIGLVLAITLLKIIPPFNGWTGSIIAIVYLIAGTLIAMYIDDIEE